MDLVFGKMLDNLIIIGAILFCLGIYTVITRRNAVGILMGVELILNSANLNFVAFSKFRWGMPDGQVFVIFVIILAAAEAAVALAIILSIFHNFGDIDVDTKDLLKE